MGPVFEGVAVLVLLVLVVLVVLAVASGRFGGKAGEPPPERAVAVSDRHTHRWTKWRIVDERKIHLYGEVDEGRDLPDRIDVVLRRECARCGLPQTQTVRGLDPRRSD